MIYPAGKTVEEIQAELKKRGMRMATLEEGRAFMEQQEKPMAEKPEDMGKKALSLAQEAAQFFADNDFAGAAERLRELKYIVSPEPPKKTKTNIHEQSSSKETCCPEHGWGGCGG